MPAKRPSYNDPLDVDPRFRKLATAARKRQAGPLQNVTWVEDNVLIDLDDIDPKTVPSSGAVTMLFWARSSVLALQEFNRSVYAKIIPSRTQIESMEKFSDDGRENLDIIDRAIEGFKDNSGEESGESDPPQLPDVPQGTEGNAGQPDLEKKPNATSTGKRKTRARAVDRVQT